LSATGGPISKIKMFKKFLKFATLGIAIALIVAFFVHNGIFMGLQRAIQNKFYDFASASPEIVIVSIDEKSLSEKELGPWQKWPRKNYAKAIDILSKEDAAVIGIDVTFPNQSIYGEKDDKIFSDSLKKNKNVVLAARYYFEDGGRIAEFPNPTLLDANPKFGWINVKLDEDGFIREIPIFAVSKEGTYEAFSLETARKYLMTKPVEFHLSDHTYKFSDDINIPVMTQVDSKSNQPSYLMYVNYFAEPGTYTRISMSDLLKKNYVDEKGNRVDLKDKIVLIGPTAADLQDYYLSPVSKGIRMPGVEIHANNIQTIITGKFLRDQSRFSLWATIIGFIILNLLIFSKLRIRFALPFLFIELFGVVVAGIVAYEQRIFLNVMYPIVTIMISFVGAFLLRLILVQSERKFIEGAFSHYVNKTIVEQIIKNPKMLELGGAKREVTAFFSDIEGFTSISEKMEPDKLVSFLNRYLDEMTNIIINYQGTLDKYEGDAIMAFWGAPLPLATHAKNACIAALENQKRLEIYRQECEKSGFPPIHIRIGINSGEVIAGNIGSKNRFDYTIMGDNVNLASRLEGINKQYGTKIIISESTYEQIKDDFVCRELDLIRVMGKEKPVRIYELLGTKEDVSQTLMSVIQSFSEALNFYRQKNFVDAQTKFQSIPDDPPSKVFAERCEGFIKNPPSADWDGVYTFTTK